MRWLELIGTLMVLGGIVSGMADYEHGNAVAGIGLVIFIIGRFQK